MSTEATDHVDAARGTVPRARLFGALQLVTADGADVTPRSRKARALAAYVLLAGAPVPRERLATLLWGDSGEEQSRASLRQALYELRALATGESPALVVTRDHVAAGSVRTDVEELEALARARSIAALADALERTTPTLLDDLTDVAPDFDDWRAGERTRVLERMLAAALVAGREAPSASSGSGASSVDDVRRLADALERFDPLDERVHRFALRADFAGGDLAALHRRHRRFRERLAAELGTRPSTETLRMFESLTRGGTGRTADEPPAHEAPAKTTELSTVAIAPSVSAAATSGDASPAPPVPPSTTSRGDARPTRIAIVAVIVAVALAVLFVVSPFQVKRAAATPPALAVLAFVELPSKRPDAYFASGVSEEIRNLLARDPKLRVVGAESAELLTSVGDARAIAQRAGVTHLLEGSVRSDAGRMTVDVRLVGASDGATLWQQRFDRPVGEVFAVQNEIALAVAGRLQGAFAPTGNAHLRTEPAVYDRYLAARKLARERRAPDLQRARRLLLEAVALDPNYAPAYASLAQVTMLLTDHPTSYGTTPLAEAQAEARSHAERALALAPGLGEAHAALGLVSTSDVDALPHFERAVSLDPQRADFHRWLGVAYSTVERSADALRELRYGAALEPLWWLSVEHLVAALIEVGRDDEAAAVVERYERLSADPFGRERVRAGLALRRGRLAEYLQHSIATARIAPGERTGPRDLATAWTLLGEDAKALAVLPDGETLGRLVLTHDADGLAREALRLGEPFWFVGSSTWGSAQALVQMGRGDVLLQLYDRSFRSPDEFYDRLRGAAFSGGVPLAVAFRDAGRLDEARRLAERLQAHLDRQVAGGVPEARVAGTRAALYAAVGNREASLAALERCLPGEWFQLVGMPNVRLDTDRTFAPFRAEPRLLRVRDAVQAQVEAQRRQAGLPAIPDRTA